MSGKTTTTYRPPRGIVAIVAAAILMAVTVISQAAAAADLKVTIAALRSTAGTVHIALYNSADAFPKPHRMLEEKVVPASAPLTTFSGIEPGTYAVAVYHDENDNSEFDQGFFGIPLEGYAFSMDARVFLGPPAFADAAFAVGAEGRAITIPMTYW